MLSIQKNSETWIGVIVGYCVRASACARALTTSTCRQDDCAETMARARVMVIIHDRDNTVAYGGTNTMKRHFQAKQKRLCPSPVTYKRKRKNDVIGIQEEFVVALHVQF